MQETDVKIALFHYREYDVCLRSAYEKYEYIETKQTKTAGSVVKMPDNNNSNEQYKLGLIERKCVIERDIERYKFSKDLADHFLRSLPEPYKSMLTDKFVKGKSNRYLVYTYNYSDRHILNIVEKAIRLYVEAT